MWSNRIMVKKYLSSDARTHKKVLRKIKWGSSDKQMLKDINQTSALNLTVKEKTYSKGDDPVIDAIMYTKPFEQLRVGDIMTDNENNTIFYISDILPASEKKLDEIKGIVISDYQSFLEKVWLEALSKKHTVLINDELFLQMQKNNFDILKANNNSDNHKKDSIMKRDFSSYFSKTVTKLGASKDVFFGWEGNIYNTEIKPHGED